MCPNVARPSANRRSGTILERCPLLAGLSVLLLMKYLDKHVVAGVVARVGIVFKTLLIIGPLYLLISGRYLAFLAGGLTLAVLVGLVYLLVGPEPLLGYLGADWVNRVLLFEFSQDINQSLLGVTVRADDDGDVHPLKRLCWTTSTHARPASNAAGLRTLIPVAINRKAADQERIRTISGKRRS
ncbi:MAG: glycosyltransferase 87 family protein [Lautropia sp.]